MDGIKKIKLSSIKPNPDNPRIIKDAAFHKLVASIKRYPDFMAKRGIVHADGVILGGNMRYRAIQEALKDESFRESIGVKSANEIPDAWVQDASDWTDEQRQAFIIADNAPFGEWNWDMLANEWDAGLLDDFGLDVPIEEESDDDTSERKISEQAPPSLTWVLIGIPTTHYHLIYDYVQAIEKVDETFCEVTANAQG